jgi:hypothetical protein
MSLERFCQIENGFWVLLCENNAQKPQKVIREVEENCIQFHFCFKGQATFSFNNGTYTLPLADEHMLLLYNPQRNLPMQSDLDSGTKMVSIFISIKKFHGLFSHEAESIIFLNEENINKKYYQDQIITPAMAGSFESDVTKRLGRTYGAFVSKSERYMSCSVYILILQKQPDVTQCPFLVDEENVQKIRFGKARLLLSVCLNRPSLQSFV